MNDMPSSAAREASRLDVQYRGGGRCLTLKLPETALEARLSLQGGVTKLSFTCNDTADQYVVQWTEQEAQAVNATFSTAGAFYNFLEESLKVAKPSQPDTPVPGTLTCAVWQGDGGKGRSGQNTVNIPKVFMKSLLHPSHNFLPTLTVDLEFPRTYVGDAEEKHAIQLRKQAEWYESVNNANLQEFKDALVAQEAAFQSRLDAAIAAALLGYEKRVKCLEAQLGDRVLRDSLSNSLSNICCQNNGYRLKTIDSSWESQWQDPFERWMPISQVANLQALAFGEVRKHTTDDNVSHRYYYVVGVSMTRAFQFCCNLRYLQVDTMISDLSPLSAQTQLVELILDRNTKITDLSPLEPLKNLEVLSLRGCTGIQDVSVVERLPSLTKLDIAGTGMTNVCSLISREGLKIIDQ